MTESQASRLAGIGEKLLRPASVALIGVSDDIKKTGARPLQFLRAAGFEGKVYPVNPGRDMVQGEQAWKSVRDLPEVPDHAYILTNSDVAVKNARECAELGVSVLTIMADGFVGSGEDAVRRRTELEDIVATTGTRIVGPSSLGVVNMKNKLILSANAAFAEPDMPVGGIFVASHSGSVIGSLLSRGKAMGVAFSGLVSTGSEIDLSLGEICLSTVDSDEVTSYALFLESLEGMDDLREFAIAAAERNKPIMAYKLGRSEAGAELSVSHTGALAGDDVVATALFESLGIGRVDVFEALLEGQNLLHSIPLTDRAKRAPRVGVVTTTGGGGAMVIDRLAVRGAIPQAASEETARRLAEMGVDAGHGSLIDLTLAGTTYEIMHGALDIILSAPEFDAVVAVAGSSARHRPELAVRPIADSIRADKPLAAFVVPQAPDALRLLQGAGIAAFRTPESCADAIVAAFSRRRPVAEEGQEAHAEGSDVVLTETGSTAVLEELGVRSAGGTLIQTDNPEIPADLSYPVVVKVHSAELPHKTDVGGVVVGVDGPEKLTEAIGRIVSNVRAAKPGVEATEVLVQPMLKGLGEVLIGYRLDEKAGPVVLLAAGGILAELYGDRSIRMAPVDIETAREMVSEVTALKALAGYRGGQRGDLDAVAQAIVAMSHAGDYSGGTVLEAEANPVFVLPDGEGCVAVDALVRLVPRGESGD